MFMKPCRHESSLLAECALSRKVSIAPIKNVATQNAGEPKFAPAASASAFLGPRLPCHLTFT